MNETQEVYTEPTEAQMRARAKQMDLEEAEARKRQIETSQALFSGINDDFFAREEELAKQIAAQNLANAAAQVERNKLVNERNAAEQKAQIETTYGKTNKPPTGFLDAAGTIPAPRNASITLQPRPDRYPPSDPRHTLSDADIIRMGMSLDGPATKVEAPQALTAEEREAAVKRMNVHLASKQQ
jgi:hypothetical protein